MNVTYDEAIGVIRIIVGMVTAMIIIGWLVTR